MEQRLERDQRAPDGAHRQGLEERDPEAGSGEPAGDEPVEADETEAGPFGDRERCVVLEHARGGETEEDRGKGDAESDRGDVLEDVAGRLAPDAPMIAP